ncbi:receptor-like protein EIX2 [Lotus japonicus]|uniref:receptor-like protein EIX2 n=1 Tax=Lotus japonicus TaxID=34305 RepID=UPI00258BF2E0|nr:receptor-like protein EIX2 [Lotus japonicus]
MSTVSFSQFSIAFLLFLSTTTFHSDMFCTSTNLQLRCNERDRSSLLQFKRGVIDNSSMLSSWSNEEDCCAWKGVHCDNITGRVTRLDLNQQYLQGEINLSLFDIEFLSYLDLSINFFSGITLPPTFNQSSKPANFSNIQYLDLSFNDDFHMDNLHWLSKLSSLKFLNLSEINLVNETSWLQSMSMHPSLLELRLASCQLTNINPSIKFVNFTSLVTLDLSGNSFHSSLPYWLFNLSSDIAHVDLSFNFLQGQIPKSLLSLGKLKSLRLHNNELNGSIPDWLGKHENLQNLVLSENLFHGSIPSSLGNLSTLVDLGISSDSLSGNLPTSLGQLFNLKSLNIGGKSLSGVLSEQHFSNLHNLESLILTSPFAFELDPEWIPPFQLEGVGLINTILGPNFPAWIYTQKSLDFLDVSKSNISSINGDKFWRFVANITHVNIASNLISADLTNITLSSKFLFMDCNNFTGRLPHISSNVFYLGLSRNSLFGPISSMFCHKLGRENSLDYLDISFNLLSGAVPDCWQYWRGLSFLFMESNNLTGELPPSMGSLIDLIILDLHNNSLFGNFSVDLSNTTNLQFINIGENNFSGTVPVKLPHSMEVMLLGSNQFEGNIPPELCTLSSLLQLDLFHNKLSGHIPPCIGNITGMGGVKKPSHFQFHEFNVHNKGLELEYRDYGLWRNLDLSSNNLSGEIPPEVFNLVQLKSLNLSRNHLTGKIPREIGHMKNLESIDLSSNKLFGEIPVTMSTLSFLEFLNLSNNGLVGQIPIGTQLQSFDASCYAGNPKLCGIPLPKSCIEGEGENGDDDESKQHGGNNDDNAFQNSLYLGLGVGFAVGFWGTCGSLFLNRAWRHAYFRFLNHVVDQLHVSVALKLKLNRFSGSPRRQEFPTDQTFTQRFSSN